MASNSVDKSDEIPAIPPEKHHFDNRSITTPPADNDRWQILVIDDESDICDIMSLSLGDQGYRVITAQNGAAGMRRFERHRPDIVITDIRMPGGGTLSIGAALTAGREIVITCKDSGTGISPDHLPHVFEPFFTTKTEGSGVGLRLSTVYGIIERHKDRISVNSRPNQETVLSLYLPADVAVKSQPR